LSATAGYWRQKQVGGDDPRIGDGARRSLLLVHGGALGGYFLESKLSEARLAAKEFNDAASAVTT
jgi:hypothetical protein